MFVAKIIFLQRARVLSYIHLIHRNIMFVAKPWRAKCCVCIKFGLEYFIVFLIEGCSPNF